MPDRRAPAGVAADDREGGTTNASAGIPRPTVSADGDHRVAVAVDADGAIVAVDDGIAELLGWSAAELVGQPLITIIPARFHRQHAEGFGRFLATGELRHQGAAVRLPARRADGTEVDVELLLSAAPPEHAGVAIGLLGLTPGAWTGSGLDGAALRSAAADDVPLPELLSETLVVLGSRTGSVAGAVWLVDSWGDLLRSGAVWEATPGGLAGYAESRSEARDRADGPLGEAMRRAAPVWVETIADSSAGLDGVAGLYLPLLLGEEVVGVVELIDERLRGLTIESQLAVQALTDELGRVVGIRSRHDREAFERRRLELALGARRMGVWTYRLATGEAVWNQQMEQLFGFEPGLTAGNVDALNERTHPDDREVVRSRIEGAVERGEQFDYRHRVVLAGGVERWIEGTGVPVADTDGEIRELTGVCYDVTDEVLYKAELEERARYSALAADVGKSLVRNAPLPEKLQSTAQAIVDNLHVAFARVWTLAEGEDVLELEASAGLYTHLDGGHAVVPVGSLKIGRIAATRQPHLTNQVIGDPQVSDQEWARREGMQAFAGYPLVNGDRCLGVLALFARRPLPETTLDALGAIADTVAIAIDQSLGADEVLRLWEQTRRHADRLELALSDRARVAQVLQESLLPPSLPRIEGFTLAARYRSGVEEVGGDFYDVLPVGDGRWAFIIGDVCGRGPEAARFTALARHSLRIAVLLGESPAGALDALNTALRNESAPRLCTAICGTFEPADDHATVSVGIAGHPPPMIVRAHGGVEELDPAGTLLGAFASPGVEPTGIELAPGDTLLVFTDGVTEARRDGEMFGADRLRAALAELTGQDPDRLLAGIVERVSAFDQSASADDLALLAIRFDRGA